MRRQERFYPQLGARYGRLTVVTKRAFGSREITVRCDCGTEATVIVHNLVREVTRSCGCLQKEETSARVRTHGTGYDDYRYRLWNNVKTKCLQPNSQDYAYYGARGITMHPEWVDDFIAFAAYIDTNLGPRPDGLTLDRINNDGNYEPGNLRWATRKEQALNRRDRWRNR